MKKILAVAALAAAALGFSAGRANAHWFSCLSCCNKCSVTIHCKQYNAFSPFCCDNMSGCMPCNGGACAAGPVGPACVGGACMGGELPAFANGGNLLLPPGAQAGGTYILPPGAQIPAGAQLVNPGAITGGVANLNGTPTFYNGLHGYTPAPQGR